MAATATMPPVPSRSRESLGHSAWIFGPVPDLLFGSGLLYLLFISGIIFAGPSAREAISPIWGSLLILIVSGAHYGATLQRVYEHKEERRAYRLFTVYGTGLMALILVGALHWPLAGSALITLYLTWSPWHYTGQNYGIAVMLLRRRGVELSPATRRWLYASFVFSFLSVFLNFHFQGGVNQDNPFTGALFSSPGVSLAPHGFHFISMGLPGEARAILMPVVGLGYVASILATIALLLRSADLRTIAPAALVMLTQAVWFAIPHLGFYLDWTTGIPALNPVGGDRFRFYFLWTAVGHAAQYLWITTYYAKSDDRWHGYGRYFAKTFVLGNAIWAAPVILLGPEGIGRPDYESGLAMCVASAVNLHHFMLDGAIWKLRNPKIASVLIRDDAGRSTESGQRRSGRWRGRLAWGIAGFFCVANVIPELEIEQRLPAALSSDDLGTAESILDRAAYYGRDSAAWRASLANRLVKTHDPSRAIPQYRRSLEFYPQAHGFSQLGILVEKLEGLGEAIAVWREGLEGFPDDYDLNRRMAAGLLKAKRPREAIPYLEHSVALRPDDADAKIALRAARKRVRPGVRPARLQSVAAPPRD